MVLVVTVVVLVLVLFLFLLLFFLWSLVAGCWLWLLIHLEKALLVTDRPSKAISETLSTLRQLSRAVALQTVTCQSGNDRWLWVIPRGICWLGWFGAFKSVPMVLVHFLSSSLGNWSNISVLGQLETPTDTIMGIFFGPPKCHPSKK